MNASRFPAYEAGRVIDHELPPRALEGVRTRRIFAILFDLAILTVLVGFAIFVLAVAGIFTFGLTWLLALGVLAILPFIALLYNAITISRWRRATPGMQLMDLEMRLTDGEPVPFLNAAVHAVLFYVSWYFLTPLILLVSLIASNKRCLHDMLANVVVVRRPD